MQHIHNVVFYKSYKLNSYIVKLINTKERERERAREERGGGHERLRETWNNNEQPSRRQLPTVLLTIHSPTARAPQPTAAPQPILFCRIVLIQQIGGFGHGALDLSDVGT